MSVGVSVQVRAYALRWSMWALRVAGTQHHAHAAAVPRRVPHVPRQSPSRMDEIVNPGGQHRAGFTSGPAMPHGSVVLNVVAKFDLLGDRKLRYRGERGIIKDGTNIRDVFVQEIAHGDVLFRVPDQYPNAYDRKSDIPSCSVFSAFNLMPARAACDATFVGVAESRVQPGQSDSNLQNPVFAAAVHGVRTLINNSRHTIEAGDIVMALPPTSTDEQKRQTGQCNPMDWAASTSVQSDRVTAVITPMKKSAYNIFFGRNHDSLTKAIAAAVSRYRGTSAVNSEAYFAYDHQHPDPAHRSVAKAVLESLQLHDDALRIRPHLGLRVVFACEQFHVADQNAPGRPADPHDPVPAVAVDLGALIQRLITVPGFRQFMESYYGTWADVQIEHTLRAIADQYNHVFASADAGVQANMLTVQRHQTKSVLIALLNDLAFSHADFCARYMRGKVIGRALASSLPGTNLIVYINQGLGY